MNMIKHIKVVQNGAKWCMNPAGGGENEGRGASWCSENTGIWCIWCKKCGALHCGKGPSNAVAESPTATAFQVLRILKIFTNKFHVRTLLGMVREFRKPGIGRMEP
jgi:hypothetical protein